MADTRRRLNVFINSESWQGALACIESMGRLGHAVYLAERPSNSPHASSKYIAGRIKIAPRNDELPEVARALAKAFRAHHIDLAIPISDFDAKVFALGHEAYPDVAAFVAPSVSAVTIASDKIATTELAERLGITVPRSLKADNAEGIARAIDELGLPAVIKIPRSTASDGVSIVNTMADVQRAVARLQPGPVLVQKFIAGHFVGVTGFAHRSVLIDSFGFRPLDEGMVTGTPTYALTVNNAELEAILKQLCQALNWSGGIDLDLMQNEAGTLHLLEINPRFSGTLVFADKLGIDLPRLYADVRMGEEVQPRTRPPLAETLFISYVPNEVSLISQQRDSAQQRAKELRERYPFVENLYPDDGPLTVAQMRQALTIAWGTQPRMSLAAALRLPGT